MDVLAPLLYKEYKTVGERIRDLRSLLAMTRKDFAKKHGIPLPTLRMSEHLENDISSKQARKLLKAFEEEGIICSEEWLTRGVGAAPIFAKHFINQELYTVEHQTASEEINLNPLLLEASLFQKYNQDSLVIRITDNTMAPLYEENDYVGGVKLTLPLESQFYNKPHIITLTDNTHMVRIIYPGTEPHLFTLTCSAPFYKSNPFFLTSVPVQSIYRVIWHRKGA